MDYNNSLRKAVLALADGTIFEGYSFGAEGEVEGEVVFNTSMTGYEEILTDPSYKGQIVVMTYPHIGNYGTNHEDVESGRPWVEGFVVRDISPYPDNWRSEEGLDAYLKRNGVVGIYGIDTRALTRHLREKGSIEGIISTDDVEHISVMEKARKVPSLVGLDLVKEVSCREPYKWEDGLWMMGKGYHRMTDNNSERYRIIAYDYGIKYNILRNLINVGCEVKVVPATLPASEVLDMKPDGVFLSNGPGDPEGVPYAVENVRGLIGRVPVFGICLGHQIIALALEGRTFKLKFGHHGANHPVKDLETGRVEITVQNHCFAVDIESLKDSVLLTHINLNDRTVEGIRHREYPVFSVQYHPEASPGPRDSSYLFKRFVELIDSTR